MSVEKNEKKFEDVTQEFLLELNKILEKGYPLMPVIFVLENALYELKLRYFLPSVIKNLNEELNKKKIIETDTKFMPDLKVKR